MMRFRAFTVLFAATMVTQMAFTQMAPPTPAPELRRLNYFVGSWTLLGDMKPSQYGPGGNMTETETNKWMQGNFFLVCNMGFKSGMGDGTGIAVMGYDVENKSYTYDAFNSWGEAEHAKGSVSGDSWTWTSESKMMGKPTSTRFTIKEGGPASYTFKFETSGPDGVWSTIMDGKATKQK